MSQACVRCHLFIVAAIGAFVYGPAAAAQEAKPAIDYAALVKSVDLLSQKLSQLRDDVDQTRFDPDAWLEELDFDAEQAVSAVSNQIVFQPYTGALRGVFGTLRSGAGNSLDQSLLLGYLLKSAGYDARIAHGALDDADVTRLLGGAASSPPQASLEYLRPAIESRFGSRAAQSGKVFDWADSAIAARADTAAQQLLQALSRAGINLQPRDTTAQFAAASRDYFWIQYRDGPSREWRDAHPAFGQLEAPAKLAAEEFFAEAIPEKYQHRLTVTAYINQRVKDKISTHALMSPYTRPIANLDGVALSYRNHPDGLNPQLMNDIDEAVAATRILIPMFNNAMPAGAMAFDLKGRVIDPMVLGSGGAASLFATLAERMEQATSSVTNPDDPKAIFALESMWLEFLLSSPDGTETRFRRYILPPQGDRVLTQEDMIWRLITDHTYVVNSGRHPLDYLADRYLAAGIASNEWYKALVHKFIRPDEGTAMPRDDVPQEFAPLSQFQFMDANPYADDAVIVYRAQPGLLGIRRGFRTSDVAFVGVDVVANAMAQFRATNGRLWLDPESAVRRGVWDTAVETIPARAMNLEAVNSANAVDVLSAAVAQKIDLLVIKPGQNSSLGALHLPAAALQAMHDELANGYALVVPSRTPEGSMMTAWWRVQPETGETLGVTADGYGQEIVEYLTEVAGIAMTLVQAVQSLQHCQTLTNTVAQLCCLIEANINNVAGLGLGGILGEGLGSAGSLLFSIVDYGQQQATGRGMLQVASFNCEQVQGTEW